MTETLDVSNWINLGIMAVTALAGILAWLGARYAAKEAKESQEKANRAAERSASAAEKRVTWPSCLMTGQ